MKKFNLGLQLYSVRRAMEKDFEGTLKAIKEMGYNYVEFAGYHGKSAEELKALLEKYDLKCVSVHQKLTINDEQKAKNEVEFLKALGVRYVVIPWFEKTLLAGNDEWENTKRDFNKMADLLAENGMMLGYHNHDFEFVKYEGKYLHDYIFDAVPNDKIFPEIDTCWVKYSGLNPEDKIREFSGRVPVVHLKDFFCNNLNAGAVYGLIGASDTEDKKEDNKFEYRPVGHGLQNFDKILEACEESGTHTVIVEQDEPETRSELEAVKLSADYLRARYGL